MAVQKCLKVSELSTLDSEIYQRYIATPPSNLLATGDSMAVSNLIKPIYNTYFNSNYIDNYSGYTEMVSGSTSVYFPVFAAQWGDYGVYSIPNLFEKNRVYTSGITLSSDGDTLKMALSISGALMLTNINSNNNAYFQLVAYGRSGGTPSDYGYANEYDCANKSIILPPEDLCYSLNGITWHSWDISSSGMSGNRPVVYYKPLYFKDSFLKFGTSNRYSILISNFNQDYNDLHFPGSFQNRNDVHEHRIQFLNCSNGSIEIKGNIASLYSDTSQDWGYGWTGCTGAIGLNLFREQHAIKSYTGIINVATNNVHAAALMFYDCRYMTAIPKIQYNINHGSSNGLLGNGGFERMFQGCSGLTEIDSPIPGGYFNDTAPCSAQSNSLRYMFANCFSLTKINGAINSVWSSYNNTNMCKGMFSGCRSLVKAPLLGLLISGTTMPTGDNNFSELYSGCTNLKQVVCLHDCPSSYNLSASTSCLKNWMAGPVSTYTYGGDWSQSQLSNSNFRFITRGYFSYNVDSHVDTNSNWNPNHNPTGGTVGYENTIPKNTIEFHTVNEYEIVGINIRYGYSDLSKTATIETSGDCAVNHVYKVKCTNIGSYISIDVTFKRSGHYRESGGEWPKKMWMFRKHGVWSRNFDNYARNMNRDGMLADGTWILDTNSDGATNFAFNTNSISTGSTATAMTYCFGATASTAADSDYLISHFTNSTTGNVTTDLVIGFGHYYSGGYYEINPWGGGTLWPIGNNHIKIHFTPD